MTAFSLGRSSTISSNEITVNGTGGDDNAAVAAAVAALNSLGAGTLVFDGAVVITGSHRFTAPISVRWNKGASLLVNHSGNDCLIWEPSINWNPFTLSTKTVTAMTTNFNHSVVVDNTTGLSKGDWVVIWGNDGLTIDPDIPCAPHSMDTDHRPLEVHQIHYISGTTIYFADPVIDKMTMQPRLAKLPMMKNINIEGGYVDHIAGSQTNYAKLLRFHCCENVTVEGIRSSRNLPGATEFYHSANVIFQDCHLAGSRAEDNIYGVICGVVNGMRVINNQFEGLRHAFATAGNYTRAVARVHSSANSTLMTCTANASTNVLTTNVNHEFQVNDVIRFYKKAALPVSSSVKDFDSDGSTAGSYYIKTVESANSFTMSTTVGGAAVDVDNVTSPQAQIAVVRWGTPLNVLVSNNVATTPVKVEIPVVGVSTGATPFNTHPEGYGITFQNNVVTLAVPNNGAISAAFDIRCRAGKVLNNTVLGNFGDPENSFNAQVHQGVHIVGDDVTVSGNTFENLGNPIYIRTFHDDAANPAAGSFVRGRRVVVQSNVFRRTNYVVVWIADTVAGSSLGSNLIFQGNTVRDCGLINGSGCALFIVPDGCVGTRWVNNYIHKPLGGNDLFSCGNSLTSSDIAFAGNVFDGWGSDIDSAEGSGTNWASIASAWSSKNTFI